jgi:hypothetical protein
MELTDEQFNILYRAYLLAREGKGQVLENWAIPDAHRLWEAGWLDRRLEDGELSWWWTAEAELALNLDSLRDYVSEN